MRDLRFRAFDTHTKQMIDTGFHFFGEVITFDMIGMFLSEHPNPKYGEHSLLRTNDVIIDDWTGLKDTNNKDVYNGDIVRIQTEDNPEDLQWSLDIVHFKDGAFRLKSATSYEELLGDYLTEPGHLDLEVIGSIHENPELLINK